MRIKHIRVQSLTEVCYSEKKTERYFSLVSSSTQEEEIKGTTSQKVFLWKNMSDILH